MSYKGKRAFDLAVAVPACAMLVPVGVTLGFARAGIDIWHYGSHLPLKDQLRLKGLFHTSARKGYMGKTFSPWKIKTFPTTDEFTNIEERDLSELARFMRSHKVDEILQLLQVVLGIMSICGPRGLDIEDPENQDPERCLVKTGLLSTATVFGLRNILTPEVLCQLDRYDRENSCLSRDVWLLKMFVKMFLKAKKAPHMRSMNENFNLEHLKQNLTNFTDDLPQEIKDIILGSETIKAIEHSTVQQPLLAQA